MLGSLLSGLIAPVAGVINKWQDGRQKKAERKDRLAEAEVNGRIARIARESEGDINYDIEAQRQMQYSWKDEFLMFVLSLPFIGSFIPVVQDYVVKGWEYLTLAPSWYQWAFLGVISATFGLRGWKALSWKKSA